MENIIPGDGSTAKETVHRLKSTERDFNMAIKESSAQGNTKRAGKTNEVLRKTTDAGTAKPDQNTIGKTEKLNRDPDEQDRLEARKQAERRKRRAQMREERIRIARRQRILAAALVLILVLAFVFAGRQVLKHQAWAQSTLSEKVLGYKDLVKKYAKQEKIEKYTDTLLAIMMAETKGEGSDVMQSSESKGLERNSLGPEESIEQACIYYAALIEIAHNLDIKDDKALIQSYNYGPGYLTYIANNGKKHTENLAIEYAKEHSGGEKVRFMHLYAIKKNGGWIYKFGNMFYEAIVESYM